MDQQMIAEPDQAEESSPASRWEADDTKRALDQLFNYARHYRSSASFRDLMDFMCRFHFYSPYNAMLLSVQMPGARFVATAQRWLRDYDRVLKPDARPLVILRPMGPVMFVFDVSDTEPVRPDRQGLFSGSGPQWEKHWIPPEVEKPFEACGGAVERALEHTVENAKRDGIRITRRKEGAQSAGSIRRVDGSRLPLLDVFKGIGSPAGEYLAGCLDKGQDPPAISLECVMKSAGLIEQMGQGRMKPRKI